MAEGARSVRNEPLLVERPAGAVWHRIREACRRLYSVEDGFVESFRSSLTHLVPELQHTTADGGRGIGEGLARAVLWAALTNDPPEVVEATFQNLGAEYNRRGFPDSGYHGAGHALLRAARDAQLSDWTSELSSGWVAYYSWLAAHLTEGAQQARSAAPVLPGEGAPAYQSSAYQTSDYQSSAYQSSAYQTSTRQASAHQAPPASPATGQIPLDAPTPLGLQLTPPSGMQPLRAQPALPPPRPLEEPGAYATPDPFQTGSPAEAVPGSSPPTGPVPSRGHGQDNGRHENERHPSGPPQNQVTPGPPSFPGPAPSQLEASGPPDATHFPEANSGHRVLNAPASLDEILDFLHRHYFAGNERALGAILTRVALRTGADLRAPRPDQRTNPAVIANVLAVLQVMGYVVQTTVAESVQLAFPTGPDPAKPDRWWNRRRPARGSR